MSQSENTNDLGAMISQLLADPQRMQQLGQMAASLGLGAPAQSSSNEAAPCGGLPDLSAVLGAAPKETAPAALCKACQKGGRCGAHHAAGPAASHLKGNRFVPLRR